MGLTGLRGTAAQPETSSAASRITSHADPYRCVHFRGVMRADSADLAARPQFPPAMICIPGCYADGPIAAVSGSVAVGSPILPSECALRTELAPLRLRSVTSPPRPVPPDAQGAAG